MIRRFLIDDDPGSNDSLHEGTAAVRLPQSAGVAVRADALQNVLARAAAKNGKRKLARAKKHRKCTGSARSDSRTVTSGSADSIGDGVSTIATDKRRKRRRPATRRANRDLQASADVVDFDDNEWFPTINWASDDENDKEAFVCIWGNDGCRVQSTARHPDRASPWQFEEHGHSDERHKATALTLPSSSSIDAFPSNSILSQFQLHPTAAESGEMKNSRMSSSEQLIQIPWRYIPSEGPFSADKYRQPSYHRRNPTCGSLRGLVRSPAAVYGLHTLATRTGPTKLIEGLPDGSSRTFKPSATRSMYIADRLTSAATKVFDNVHSCR